MDFRTTYSAYQNNSNIDDQSLIQAYQDYHNAYQQKTCLYNIIREHKRSILIIYNTETETQEIKILKTSQPIDQWTCVAQLPNGKLFCFDHRRVSGIAVLIDMNGEVKVLPSGTSCKYSSCIYFNNSVYCFGGFSNRFLTLSSRFDLYQNRWIQLAPMPKADETCNSVIFNGNILISGYRSKNLFLYSIDINSFSTITYEFGAITRKVLISAERLYLIEFGGSIYESEIGSYMNWRRLVDLTIINPSQVYCVYNKGGIYAGLDRDHYFKFDLNEKKLIAL
ncbi:unnamed protein product [Blepharisma stoltei]|uniref:Kelch motif family protein n=1 Tax=Blepharisma stoltei TaxID=1481888 RepID=A0AAU9JDE1_9CILI|nr:unnamed protein product [Blepharisma stoltei]